MNAQWLTALVVLNLTSAELNTKVLDYARSQLGKTVGDGQCTALVRAALREAGACRYFRRGEGDDLVWGERLEKVADAQPGDVLQFQNAVFKGRRNYRNGAYRTWKYEYPHHSAIVYAIKRSGKSVMITLIHQNVATQKSIEGDSKPVRLDTINLSELQPGGEVIAYRPLADD